MGRLPGTAAVVILVLAACGGSEEIGPTPQDQAAGACDDVIELFVATQAGDDLQGLVPRLMDVRADAAAAAAKDSTWDSMVGALDRMITALESRDTSEFDAATMAFQNACGDALDAPVE
jgi:hypothetical protein